MLRMRSRIAATLRDDQRLAVQINIWRRVLYGSIAALLVVAFAISYDGSSEQTGSVAGMVFYAVLTLSSALVAGWNHRTLIGAERVQTTRSIFGIPLGASSYERARIDGVTLQTIALVKSQEIPTQGLFNSRLRGFASRRGRYFKLFLEIDGRRQLLEDSSYQEELESVGTAIAHYLDMPLQREEV